MSAAKKSIKVRCGNNHLTVAPWTHPGTGKLRWRFAYRPAAGQPWKYRVLPTKAEAVTAAEAKLEALTAGTHTLEELSPARRRFLEEIDRSVSAADQARVLDYIRAMAKSAGLAAAVSRFLAGKTSKAGGSTPHLVTVGKVLEHMAAAFPGKNVTDIHLPDLADWFAARTAAAGWKRKKDIRAAAVQFWRWAQKEGIAGNDATTVADRLPEIGGEHGARLILSLDEYRRLQDAIHPNFRAWLILGCFAGLRPEEIAPGPSKRTIKRGLHCEEIDWQFGLIRIAPEVSKVGLPRVVPLSAACRAGLEWAGIGPGMTGPTTLENPAQTRELARLGKLIFAGAWPKDICRHSYGSFRNAILRNMGQVAEEMGTSIAMLHRHYHNPRAEQEGQQWFAIRPGVPICSDETEVEALFSTASG